MDRTEIFHRPLDNRVQAALILEKWMLAQELRDKTLAAASEACRAALDCGDLLVKQKELHKGEFLLWLKCYVPQISESTAQRYMRISQLRRALPDGGVDLQTIKQFYILAGIMPPHTPTARNPSGQMLQFWAFAGKLVHWLPQLPENQKPRLRDWWEKMGRAQGWL